MSTATEYVYWVTERYEVPIPDISGIVTEDDQPVDNIYSEKQQRLLTEPLYSSWSGPPTEEGDSRPFLALANVGVYASLSSKALVPDVLVSIDVQVHPAFLREKAHRSYLCWEFGKSPDLVVEIVSNKEGHEEGQRMRGYARIHVPYYVIWDPRTLLSPELLRIFELRGDFYVGIEQLRPDWVGLQLLPWEGEFEGVRETWLRWHLTDGHLLPTGGERAEAERVRAEAAERRVRELEALLQAATRG